MSGATLVLGAALLAATLRVPRESAWFTVLDLLLAAIWVIGALLAPPFPIHPRAVTRWATAAVFAVAAGGGAFVAFYGASRVAQHVPVVSGAIDDVLDGADSGPGMLVSVVALTRTSRNPRLYLAVHRWSPIPGPARLTTASTPTNRARSMLPAAGSQAISVPVGLVVRRGSLRGHEQ